jgi:hypothetical protein
MVMGHTIGPCFEKNTAHKATVLAMFSVVNTNSRRYAQLPQAQKLLTLFYVQCLATAVSCALCH